MKVPILSTQEKSFENSMIKAALNPRHIKDSMRVNHPSKICKGGINTAKSTFHGNVTKWITAS